MVGSCRLPRRKKKGPPPEDASGDGPFGYLVKGQALLDTRLSRVQFNKTAGPFSNLKLGHLLFSMTVPAATLVRGTDCLALGKKHRASCLHKVNTF
jgi:hypothetical protein